MKALIKTELSSTAFGILTAHLVNNIYHIAQDFFLGRSGLGTGILDPAQDFFQFLIGLVAIKH